MSSRSKHVITWRRRTKERMVASFGGKCCICKMTYPQEVFEFHHLNPADKEFGLGTIRSNCISWKRIVKELRKCVMTCANCHRLVEYGYVDLPRNTLIFNENYANYKTKIKHKVKWNKCICGRKKQANRKYCCQRCFHSHTRKVNWPTKDELKLLLRDHSLNRVGQLYGVTHNAVKKWKAYYNL